MSLFLGACGPEWEMRPYTGTPYDGDRTAGTGIEYVLDHMAPAHGVNTTPAEAPKAVTIPPAEPKAEPAPAPKIEPTPAPEAAAPAPAAAPAVQNSDKLFNDKQRK